MPVIIGIIVVMAVLVGIFYKKHTTAGDASAVSATAKKDMSELNVLFVGDSYTFVNNLPHMIANVAASDIRRPVRLNVAMLVHGNYTLEQLWNMPNRDRALNLRQWNVVVLQPHSMQTLLPEWVQTMQQYFVQWNYAVDKIGAHTLIYETWARKPGSQWYTTNPHRDLFKDPEYMQKQVDMVTNVLAKYIHAPIVPVGDYFAYCRSLRGAPELYYQDGTHPSLAGDYLVALLFSRRLTGSKPEDITYVPQGLSQQDAKFIVHCASYGETAPL